MYAILKRFENYELNIHFLYVTPVRSLITRILSFEKIEE